MRGLMGKQADSWEFWADRGGTFTDVIGRSPAGELCALKVLSVDPARPDDAIVRGILAILAGRGGARRISTLKIGTTVATNALLERRGEPLALLTTRGFADVLRIGPQSRPDIFALDIRLPEPLCSRVAEADERVTASGEVLQPLDEQALAETLAGLRAAGLSALAICFLHGYRYPAHEQRAGELARAAGFGQISLSHEVNPLIRLLSRADTTVADAYLSPVLGRYVAGLAAALAAAGLEVGRLRFMQSHGGLCDAGHFRGSNSVLSGPAGGVAGMVSALAGNSSERLIGFDMGGTSTDISLYAGAFEVSSQNEVAGVRLATPMLRVHTIAAGGGSLLRFADGRFLVGPQSAGADPGPACYRRGGPLAVTDANLLLGRLVAARFPAVFGTGSEALDPGAASSAFASLAAEVSTATGEARSAEQVAAGFLEVAVDNMANAIREVALRRGADVRDFTLACFGGAAAQLACPVASRLGIRRIAIHPLAGVLSAVGIGLAPLRALRQQGFEAALEQALLAELPAQIAALAAACRAELAAQDVPEDEVRISVVAEIRLAGSDTSLPVPLRDPATLAAEFRALHRQVYGFTPAESGLVLASVRVTADSQSGALSLPAAATAAKGSTAHQPLWSAGRWQQAQLIERSALAAGDTLSGPALVTDANTTVVVDPGWRLVAGEDGTLLLEPAGALAARPAADGPADPVLLEIINNHFMHVASQMGVVLEQTASSVNIKERLDFSCALFDSAGRLIANAPHIPVHLGSMGESVRAVLADGKLRPGSAIMLNSPYAGGTHLPDVTVVSPLYDEAGRELLFIVASRAHHTDIGGITPGSMPALSRHIDEEGVLFAGMELLLAGELQTEAVLAALGAGPQPARDPARNLADLKAQLAANERGLKELRAMLDHFGLGLVQRYTTLIRENAAAVVRELIGSLADGDFAWALDSGEKIQVRIRVDHAARRLLLDFSGSAAQAPGNLNAPAAVTRACVLYVLRCLLGKPIPLNEGCFEPLDIRIPPHSVLDPDWPAAVVGGNVETSQCVSNVLLAALGRLAAGQGTMNNLSFGNAEHQYYETIGGGAGAGDGFAGASGVHTHMTNSRITDAEIIEQRLPVLLREFALRPDSGGHGLFPGGDGLRRRFEFGRPMTLSLITGSRRQGPFGLAGGDAGQPGRNTLLRRNGSCETLPAVCTVSVGPGDVLLVETPGGGGFGNARTF